MHTTNKELLREYSTTKYRHFTKTRPVTHKYSYTFDIQTNLTKIINLIRLVILQYIYGKLHQVLHILTKESQRFYV